MSKVLILGSFITAMFYSSGVAQTATAPMSMGPVAAPTTTVSTTVPVLPTPPPRRVIAQSTTTTPTTPPMVLREKRQVAVFEPHHHPHWVQLAQDVGWPVSELSSLDYVIHRESRGIPTVHNTDDPASGSRGLMQINGFWCRPTSYNPHAAGWLGANGIVKSCDDLFDPESNLRAALAIWEYGVDRHQCGWGPWQTEGFNPCRKH